MMNRTLPYMNAFGTVDISGTKTVDEALERAGLDWNVEAKPIYDENGKPYGKFKANVRDTDGELLGIVGDRYSIVQNRDAFD